jgi:hypothetical protein
MTVEQLLSEIEKKLQNIKGDLLFDPLIEDLENGNRADYIILACSALDQAACYLRLAKRN